MSRTRVGKPFSLSIDANNAIDLNGTTQYGTVPTFTNLENLSSFTIEFWCSESSSETDGVFWRMQNGATRYAEAGNDNGNNDLNFAVDYNTNDAFGGNTGSLFSTNTWTHFAFVHDGSAKNCRNYINGVLQSNGFSGTGSTTKLGFASTNLTMGWNTASSYMDGAFACFRVWNTVRTQAEIEDNMNYYLDPTQENLDGTVLVGNYNFNQGSGTSVENTVSSGTGDMALTGTPTWIAGPTLTTKPYNGPRTTSATRTASGTRTLAT